MRGSVLRIVALGLVAALALGAGGCAKKKKPSVQKPDPVATALQAPGVRTVIIPKQRNTELTIAVPPCSAAQVDQESTEVPPGSNQVVVPKDSLSESVAVQPCTEPAGQGSKAPGTVILTPGGAGGGQAGKLQLVLPNDSKLTTVIVPPCTKASGGSSQSGGSSTALPSTGDKESVTAPPCTIPAQPAASGGA